MESELVSGFMTEHAAVVFVFFFLAEYSSIVLMCILTSILFLGGYIFDLSWIINFFMLINSTLGLSETIFFPSSIHFSSILEGAFYGTMLGIKTSFFIFLFIWTRASFPRIRFDQLMSFCWTVLLPFIFGMIILVPTVLYNFILFPININLL